MARTHPTAPRRPAPPHAARPKSAPPPLPRLNPHRRGKAINRSASAVAGIFFIFVFIYLVRMFYTFLTAPHIQTEALKLGSIDVPSAVTGIIIRDEYVYTADREGRVTFNISDYERVKSGMVVCSIQNVEAVAEINLSMESIEEQIFALQELRKDISQADPAVQRVNAQIKNILDSRLQYFTMLNTGEIYNLKESLAQMIDGRNQIIIDDNKDAKDELNIQQQHLLNRLNTHVSSIHSDRSGIMSPVIDRFESQLTLENMRELSREQTVQTVDYNKIILSKDVKPDDPVFKIIASNTWYIAAYISNNLIEGYEEGDTRIIYAELKNEFIPLTTKIEMVSPGFRESYVLFRCAKNMLDFINTRNITIKTTESVRRGYKISDSAIAERSFYVIPSEYIYVTGQQEYVIKQTADAEEIVPVKTGEKDDNYAYVPVDTFNLNPGDVICLSARVMSFEIGETLTIHGVYRVNNGYAEFKRITLDGDIIPAGGYTVLNPALNQGLRAYDYIVTHAQTVADGQLIN